MKSLVNHGEYFKIRAPFAWNSKKKKSIHPHTFKIWQWCPFLIVCYKWTKVVVLSAYSKWTVEPYLLHWNKYNLLLNLSDPYIWLWLSVYTDKSQILVRLDDYCVAKWSHVVSEQSRDCALAVSAVLLRPHLSECWKRPQRRLPPPPGRRWGVKEIPLAFTLPLSNDSGKQRKRNPLNSFPRVFNFIYLSIYRQLKWRTH